MVQGIRKTIVILSAAIALLSYTFSAYAAENYYHQHEIGWHWYNEKIIAENIKKAQQHNLVTQSSPVQSSIELDPTKTMMAIRATVERALNQAILDPTVANIKAYLILQNKISNQSTNFANVWQKALLENPELNYSLKSPTNTAAKQIYLDNYHEHESEVITEFFKTRGLFFFYSSRCSYCQKFAPLVKNFALRHNVSVIPITTDGVVLPIFPNSKIDNGQALKFKVTMTPALFAVNPYNNKAIPIAYGFISESDLRQRILDIATDFKNNL